MITVSIENDDQGDLFVSITDLNQAGSPLVVDKKRLNLGESMPVEVQEDGDESAKITWMAQRTDKPAQTARRTVTPGAGDTVEVTTQFG
jgi:hypothetical protein